MNTSTTEKATETTNQQGGVEKKVGTVDCRSSAGQVEETKPVEVVHQIHPGSTTTTTGGVLADAAAAVANTLQSAREAVSQEK